MSAPKHRPSAHHIIPAMLHGEARETHPGPAYNSIVRFSEKEAAYMRDKLDRLYCLATTDDERLILSAIIQAFDADACVIARCKREDTINDAAYGA